MTTYTIFSQNEEPTSRNLLANHLAGMPMDIAVVSLVTDLFERYVAKGIGQRFAIRPFSSSGQDSHGLLVGATDLIAVFWRASSGHFWLRLDEVSFEHPAAMLEGSRSPLIDKPRPGACYRFSAGIFRALAKPYTPCELAKQYLELVKVHPGMASKKTGTTSEETEGAPAGQNFSPASGFDLFGG